MWLHVLGVGQAGFASLPASHRTIVSFAETVIGPGRLLAEVEEGLTLDEVQPVPETSEMAGRRGLEAVARALLNEVEDDDDQEPPPTRGGNQPRLVEWQGGIEAMLSQVMRMRDTPTVILATGDPMWFGIGATLVRHLAPDEFEIHPYVSSFQLAAAEMRWPLQNVDTISLHGRPAELIHPFIQPASRVLALTSDAGTAQEVAEILIARGYAGSQMAILEDLGGPGQNVTHTQAIDLDIGAIGDFYVLALDCVADDDAMLLPAVPGLPDEAFVTDDGQLTKREVRAATLAKLAPVPRQMLWDVGAGSGSVAIEWMRSVRGATAIAFEQDEARCRTIATNASALGAPELRIINGDALGAMEGEPAPDALFLGGSIADDELFAACWNALKPGGRLVANAVTVEGEAALYGRQARYGGELVRISTSVLDALGNQKVMRPRMDVLQWSVTKLPEWELMFR